MDKRGTSQKGGIDLNGMTGDLEGWFLQRPKWIQEATARIIRSGELSDSDYADLLAICKVEAEIKKPASQGTKLAGISAGSLTRNRKVEALRLNAITNIQGVNALAPRNPLKFGSDSLTVVYGQNGSGKSGYVRILKHACGARQPGKLLGNVFEKYDSDQSCTFSVTAGQTTEDILWSPELGVNDKLRTISLFDTDCAQVYVNNENEVTYEPSILYLFTQLTEACSKVADYLQSEIDHAVSKKPTLPQAYDDTVGGAWYTKLNYQTTVEEINTRCRWTVAMETDLGKLIQRVAEPNPAVQSKNLRESKIRVDLLSDRLRTLTGNLSADNCALYIAARDDARTKRKAVDEDVIKVFGGAPLEGVGSLSWKLLWEQARSYSESLAYPSTAFPNTGDGSKCILCQQPLSDEAKQRFRSFEEYVRGELELLAQTAEGRLVQIVDAIGHVPLGDDLNLLLDAAGISNSAQRQQLVEYCSSLGERKLSLHTAHNLEEVGPVPDNSALTILASLSSSLEEQAATHDLDAKAENRDALQKLVKDFKIQKWLSEQYANVSQEVRRLNFVHGLEIAKRLTSTQALSNKKSSLTEMLVTEAYAARFQDELRRLGAMHIKVELVRTRTKQGHVYHQIRFTNSQVDVSASDVLSEGEFRIVSLAAFLADVGGEVNCAPCVFDDPISSLDQTFEEATVARLIELSKSRQVIVFTHRLSMVALLEEVARKQGIISNVIYLRRESWGIGEPGDTPMFAKNTESALNHLLNERIPKARKVLETVGRGEYESVAKSICSDVRILVERLIENDLLADVIKRFRRSITTVGKLQKLASITVEDCELLDDYMTKYSRFEHAQPDEAPVILPEPTELLDDVSKLKEWQREFKTRQPDSRLVAAKS